MAAKSDEPIRKQSQGPTTPPRVLELDLVGDVRNMLRGRKTYLTAAAAALMTAVAWSTGELTGVEAARALFEVLIVVFLRAGIGKAESVAEAEPPTKAASESQQRSET